MMISFYLRKGIVYVPTCGKTEGGGPWRNIEPVTVVPFSDTTNLRRAFHQLVARGNPIVSNYSRSNQPPLVLPKYAGVKTYSAFYRGTFHWTANNDTGVWEITPWRKHAGGGFQEDISRTISLPQGSTLDHLCDHVIEILQAAGRE